MIQLQLIDGANEFYMNSGGHQAEYLQCNPSTYQKISSVITFNGYIQGTQMKVQVFRDIEDDMVIIGSGDIYPLTKKLSI